MLFPLGRCRNGGHRWLLLVAGLLCALLRFLLLVIFRIGVAHNVHCSTTDSLSARRNDWNGFRKFQDARGEVFVDGKHEDSEPALS